jgi:hypothetical protein
MKRLLLEIVLAAGLAGAGFFGWTNWNASQANGAKLTELTAESESSVKKLETAEAEVKANAAELETMKAKTQELDAVKAALASGETLKDLETVYKKEKTLSADRQVGLGALRLLTKGSKDPSTIEAFRKALVTADWGSRKKVICAAQFALAAAGEKVEVLGDCATPAEKAGQADKDKLGGADKASNADKGKDDHAEKPGEKHAVHWGYEAPWALIVGAMNFRPAQRASLNHR